MAPALRRPRIVRIDIRIALASVLAARLAAAAPTVVLSAGDLGPTGLPFSTFSDAALDDRGGIAFLGGSTGAFRHEGAATPHLLAAGDPVSGGTIAGVGPPALSADGCSVFRAFLVGGGDGIFRQCGGAPAAVASRGDAAPGGGTYAAFLPAVAVTGAVVAFGARLDDGTSGLFVANGGSVSAVVRTGAPSPAGGTFATLRLVGVSAAGRVGFAGSVTGGSDGLFSFDGNAITAIMVLGQASPAGGSFNAIGNGSLNDAGTWTFRAGVSASPGSGIFRATVGSGVPQITVVAREGDAVPAPLGGHFRAFPTSLTPTINAAGAIAFRGTVSGGASGSGIFVAQPGAAPTLVLVAGDATTGRLARFRDVAVAEDGSLLLAASPVGGAPGMFVVRDGAVTPVAGLEDATDVGTGFRFSAPSVRATAEGGVFLGQREGVFVVRSPGVIEGVAVAGAAAPGGGIYAGFDPPSAGAGGRVAFHADIAHARRHASEAIFVASDGQVRRVARVGAAAPGGGDFAAFLSGAIDGVVRADIGVGGVSFEATLEHARGSAGLFLWNRSLRPVARERQRVPGGGRYAAFGTPSVGAARQVGFVAGLVGTIGDQAVAVRTGARTKVLTRAGDTTETRAGGRFQSFDGCDVGAAGVVFRAGVSSAARQGIFLVRDPQRGALALAGDAAPGGGTFGTLGLPGLAAQSVVFLAQLVDQPVANGLYRVSAATVPASTDPPLPVEALLAPGDTLATAGTILDVGHPSTAGDGTVATTLQLVGGGTPAAIVTIAPAP